ncbi:hypothetical protein D3C84_1072170 [compost metagenome]
MELGLQLAVGLCQLSGIELEALCQPEQLEMIHLGSSDKEACAAITLVLRVGTAGWEVTFPSSRIDYQRLRH